MYISVGTLIFIFVLFFFFLQWWFEKKYFLVPKSRGFSYQVRIVLAIEWIEIIRWCFPELKTKEEAWEFIHSLYNDSNLGLIEGGGLFQKNFIFVEIYDGVSGLNLNWVDNYKEFKGELEIQDYVFTGKDQRNIPIALWEKFRGNPLSRRMVISPYLIGFRSDLPDGDMGENDKISKIPYPDIVGFFADVYRNAGGLSAEERAVKKFPDALQKYLEKCHVKYNLQDYEDYGTGVEFHKEEFKYESKWLKRKDIELYDQRMKSHIFKTPYYSISLQMKFFNFQDR